MGSAPCPTSTGATAKDRPFYSGEERPSDWCDYLPDGANECCNGDPAYAVWWHPVPAMDLDTQPVSVSCLAHVAAVDRSLVLHMTNDFDWRPTAGTTGRESDG